MPNRHYLPIFLSYKVGNSQARWGNSQARWGNPPFCWGQSQCARAPTLQGSGSNKHAPDRCDGGDKPISVEHYVSLGPDATEAYCSGCKPGIETELESGRWKGSALGASAEGGFHQALGAHHSR
eukprot:3363823-Pyramimonas_sp.AAC.1